MAELSISKMKTNFIAGISEPFDQPPFCFDKMNKHQKSLTITEHSMHLSLLVPEIIYHQRISVFCIYTAFSQTLHKSDTYRGNKEFSTDIVHTFAFKVYCSNYEYVPRGVGHSGH